jgi:Peptidase_C39 like family
VKPAVLRSLHAITGPHTRSALLGVAAAAIIGGLVAGPPPAVAASQPATVTAVTDTATTAPKPSPAKAAVKPAAVKPAAVKPAPVAKKPVAKKSVAKKPATKKPATKKPAAKAAAKRFAAAKSLKHDPALQPNGYYCGPAATRIALSAVKKAPSHDRLAKQLGTTTAGTNSVADITRVLNMQLGSKRYRATKIPNAKPTPKQVAKLRADIVSSISKGEPVVANIVGTVTDNAGARHSYEGGHYLTVVGYQDNGKTVKITDPADRVGGNSYKISTKKLAKWIATRGYSS